MLIAAAAVIFAVGLGLGLAFVGTHGGGAIQSWDNQVQAWSLHHRGGLVGAAKIVAFLGDAPKLAVVTVIISAIWWLASRSTLSLLPIAAYLGGEFQVFAIRQIIHRHRPPTANYPAPGAIPGIHETSFSYPSGHSVAVTAILITIAATAAYSRHQWWPLIPGVIASMYIADTRLVLGVHWFSDVTFGLILGTAWGLTVAWAGQRLTWNHLTAWIPQVRPLHGNTPKSL
ncbi:MAG: phosphatase PAP2 family protein [Acidobacteriota bacterium]|nr:phosphatase PAP2 family protein [Acidobacteriota bacterium]